MTMKKSILLLAWAVLFTGEPIRASETPETQLEFVRNLREKGYADLALEYLDELKKHGDAAVKAVLSLEVARTQLALARDKEPAEKMALIKSARAELEAFVKANPNRVESALGRLDLAKILAQEARTRLRRALKNEDIKAKQDDAGRAEPLFIQAGTELDFATKALAALETTYKDPDAEKEKQVRERLKQKRLDARLERGLMLLQQAQTYVDTAREDVNRKRAEMIQEATKTFKELAAVDKTNATCLVATAWLMRCAQESQDPQAADKAFKDVIQQPTKAADEAKRWARYFHLRGTLDDPRNKDPLPRKLRTIQIEAEGWLADYPRFKTTEVGQGVQFELAKAYYQEAQLVSKDPKSAKATKFYNLAQKYLVPLAEGDGEHAEEANQLNLSISFLRMGTTTPVENLKDFQDCFLKGHYEMFQLKKLMASKGDEKSRKEHVQRMIQAFARALRLADSKTTPHKLAEAKLLLVYAYMFAGDPYRTAVAGEALAMEQPPSKGAAQAAAYAVEAYRTLLARDNASSTRQRLFHLAAYILGQKVWRNEPVIPIARYQLATVYQREEKYPEAISLLEQLGSDYSGYVYSQGQLALIALKARSRTKDEKQKAFYLGKAVAALKRVKELSPDADPATAAMFFFSQLEYPKLLFNEGIQDLAKNVPAAAAAKFKEMSDDHKHLAVQFAKLGGKLSDDTRSKVAFTMDVVGKLARLGLAEVDYKLGHYDKVLAPDSAGGLVAEIKKLGQKPGPIRLPDFEVVGNVLGLSLRAYVQKGKVADAKEVLQLIGRVTGPEGTLAPSSTSLLQALVQELETHVRALQKSGDTEKLQKMVANFSSFADELAKTARSPTDFFFLARYFDSLGEHCKAAGMYSKVAAPAALTKKEKLDEKDERELQTYWYAQIRFASQLRQCPENKAENLKRASKLLTHLLNHPNARGQMQAEKERIHVFEEMGLYGACINQWTKFMNNPALKKRLSDDQSSKETYFDAYYHYVYCFYKLSQEPKYINSGKGKLYLRRAADYIIRLEETKDPTNPSQPGEGWQIVGQRFRELIQAEPALRQIYDELKAKMK
jgi:hypothetical protein